MQPIGRESTESGSRVHRASVLIVDDDEEVRGMLQQILEREGYRVHTASQGKEALLLLDTLPDKPGLILLDLMMPVMTGEEMLAALRRVHALADIPVAFVSGKIKPPPGSAPFL